MYARLTRSVQTRSVVPTWCSQPRLSIDTIRPNLAGHMAKTKVREMCPMKVLYEGSRAASGKLKVGA